MAKSTHDNKILPPRPIKKKRGKKQKASRKEAEELEQATLKGRHGKKGKVAMTCNICGAVGHNRRYHGLIGAPDGTASRMNQYVC